MTVEQLKEGQILLFDKATDWTSFDVVNKLRGSLKIKKVGHAGTLDPLATGLLIICTSRKTKEINNFIGLDKTYTGEITLGATTPSFDLETEINQTYPTDNLSEKEILQGAEAFVGWQNQIAPDYSAKKTKGKKFYEFARKGEKPPLRKKWVRIFDFSITSVNLPKFEFSIRCSSGTYIRTIAYDFGRFLNNGGYLSKLRRTKIGEYDVKDAYEINEFINKINASS